MGGTFLQIRTDQNRTDLDLGERLAGKDEGLAVQVDLKARVGDLLGCLGNGGQQVGGIPFGLLEKCKSKCVHRECKRALGPERGKNFGKNLEAGPVGDKPIPSIGTHKIVIPILSLCVSLSLSPSVGLSLLAGLSASHKESSPHVEFKKTG